MEMETTLPLGWFTRTATAMAAAPDPDALAAEHRQMVYRIAYSVLRNHADASDAAQDAFLRVFRASDKLAVIEDRKAWIARIAWNAALDAKRKSRAAAGTISVEDLARGVATLRDAGRSPEEIAAGSEMQRLLAQLIETLPDGLRQPLLLSTVEELEYREIAATLGIGEAAVRSRLFQARQRLKEKLENLL
jgi:RNA polymerase sigma-70 factor (ECF subfamily)